MILDCLHHHTKERNTKKLIEEEHVQKYIKVSFNKYKYCFYLKKTKKDT